MQRSSSRTPKGMQVFKAPAKIKAPPKRALADNAKKPHAKKTKTVAVVQPEAEEDDWDDDGDYKPEDEEEDEEDDLEDEDDDDEELEEEELEELMADPLSVAPHVRQMYTQSGVPMPQLAKEVPVAPVVPAVGEGITAEQMMCKILAKVDALEELQKASPKLTEVTAHSKTVTMSDSGGFLLTPSKKSLGKMRSAAHKAATKVVFMKVALFSPNVQLSEAAGAIALAINLTVPAHVTGSISGAFISQMRTALNQLLREVKSDLVGNTLDTFILVNPSAIAPRVKKVHAELFEARKVLHITQFGSMLAAPEGFDIVTYPNMHAFHAIVVDAGLEAFGSPSWHEFVKQFLLRVPQGARRLNLNNLSFILVALVARLTFTDKDGVYEYGQLDDRIYTQSKYETMQAWIMDPDLCPTKWPEVLRIRAENKNYRSSKD